jgi:hypothetical protein
MIATLLLFTVVVCATWFLPRRLRMLGLFLAHAITAVVLVVGGAVEIAAGRIDYDDPFIILGWLLQAFMINVLALPLGIFAVIRHARANGPGPRGFPVIPTVPAPDQSHADAVRDTLPADDRA